MSNIQNISSRLHELRLQLTGLANDFDDRDEIPPSDIDLLRETASAIDELVALSTDSECSANNTGIVIQSLTDSIRNRDAIITALRDENARAQSLLHERCANYTNRCEEVERLEKIVKRQRQSIRDLREEIELDTCISASAETELVRLRADLAQKQHECEELKKQIDGWRTECEIHERDEKELYRLRDEARRQYCELVHNTEGSTVEKIAHFNGWNDLYPAADNTPNLFEQQSDSDPVTGVQYGDLI